MFKLDDLKSFAKALDAAEWTLRREVKSGEASDFWMSESDAEAIAKTGPGLVPALGKTEADLVGDLTLAIALATELGQESTVASLTTARHSARVAYARVLAGSYHATAIAAVKAESDAEKSAEAAAE